MSNAAQIEEINSTRRKFNISVPATEVEKALNSITTEMQSTAEMRGFRKGKAPLNLVKKFYINDIIKKAADKIIGDAYSSAAKNVDFQIVSQPHIEPENQFDGQSEFKFTATVDINPKLEMQNYKELSIKLPESLKTNFDEQYNKLIESYLKAFDLTEANDEFAKRLGYETMDIAKEKIMETLDHTSQEMKVNAAFDQIVDQILAQNSFEVAQSLIDSTIDRAIQEAGAQDKRSDESTRQQFHDTAVRNVRGILALGHIARQEGIQVTDEEIYRDLTNYAMANRIHPRDLMKNGAQVIDEFRGQATIRKVVNKILDMAKVEYTPNEEKISAPE